LGKFWRALKLKMLAYFTAIWYICWLFGTFFPVLVYCTKKNLANLPARTSENARFPGIEMIMPDDQSFF
jgi:hypothetical protein